MSKRSRIYAALATLSLATLLFIAFNVAAWMGPPFIVPEWGPNEETRVRSILARCEGGMKGRPLPELTARDEHGATVPLAAPGKHHFVVEGSFT